MFPASSKAKYPDISPPFCFQGLAKADKIKKVEGLSTFSYLTEITICFPL
jgi:hypothetical protein